MGQLILILVGLLLSGNQYCAAQSGYNYARPEDAGAGQNLQVSGKPAIRPIVGGGGVVGVGPFPTAASAAGSFPTSPTAYGVNGVGGAALNPATAYAGFPAQTQPGSGTPSLYNPAAIGPTGYATVPKRPIIPQQRPTTGIYGVAQQEFGATGGNLRGGAIRTGGDLNNDYDGDDFSAIPGIPGVSYPVYAEVPPTNFDCSQQPLPGYYSDIEAQCQVFHICALNRTYSFLCPNGTIFSQETLVCVWWNQYDCASAPSLYANNAFIYDYSNQGSNAIPTVGTYQANLAVNRPQASFQPLPNAGRATGVATGTGIYGSASIRPTLPTGGYAGGQARFPTAVGNTGTAGRYGPNAPQGQAATTYTPGIAAAAATPTTFGTGNRNEGYQNTIQENVFPTAQVATKSANREYLPPGRN